MEGSHERRPRTTEQTKAMEGIYNVSELQPWLQRYLTDTVYGNVNREHGFEED